MMLGLPAEWGAKYWLESSIFLMVLMLCDSNGFHGAWLIKPINNQTAHSTNNKCVFARSPTRARGVDILPCQSWSRSKRMDYRYWIYLSILALLILQMLKFIIRKVLADSTQQNIMKIKKAAKLPFLPNTSITLHAVFLFEFLNATSSV